MVYLLVGINKHHVLPFKTALKNKEFCLIDFPFFPQDDTIHMRRACVLKSLCIYLNEDHEKLVKDYMVSYICLAKKL